MDNVLIITALFQFPYLIGTPKQNVTFKFSGLNEANLSMII